MRKLPKIYQNNINKNFNNNMKISYVKDDVIINNDLSTSEVLDEIFNGYGQPYNIDVIINTNDRVYDTSIISRNRDSIFTLDNDIIKISEIRNIVIK